MHSKTVKFTKLYHNIKEIYASVKKNLL